MELKLYPYTLELKHPFGVSSNTRTTTPSVYVGLSYNGLTGYGEACLPAYLGETVDTTVRFLQLAADLLRPIPATADVHTVLKAIDALGPGCEAAKAAVDIALHDLKGKMDGLPFYSQTGLGKSPPRATSLTIGIDSEALIAKKITEAADFQILKIKIGTADDKALVNTVRKYTSKPLYVDANQGWNDRYEALDMAHWLKEQNVLLIEQPFPVRRAEESAWLSARSPLPVIADESVKRLHDLDSAASQFSGVNIKLMKCTGLYEAMNMIGLARRKSMKVMLGCMAESSCATSAMAQLMSLADFIDLDAPNLISNDPFVGVTYQAGTVVLSDLPGIGVRPVTDHFSGK